MGDQGIAGEASLTIANFAALKRESESTSLSNLPADWTLHQTIAWIMFRDPTVVKSVAGLGCAHFNKFLNTTILPQQIMDQSSAREELLVRLRASDISSKGLTNGSDEAQVLQALEWTSGEFGSERDHPILRHRRFRKKFWFDVSLAKVAIVSSWPANQSNSIPDGSPQPDFRAPSADNGPDCFPTGVLSPPSEPFTKMPREGGERYDIEREELVQEKMWALQPAITREITQTENVAIPHLLAASSTAARDAELRRLWQWRNTLKADERKLLSAERDEIHAIVDGLWRSYAHLVLPSDLPPHCEELPPLFGFPMTAAGLPSDAWIRATEAFAWLAFRDLSKFGEFWDRLKASPDLRNDSVLNEDISKLADVSDLILVKIRSENCFLYIPVAQTTDMERLPSWIFSHGVTVNIFHGVLDQAHEDLNAGREIITAMRKKGYSGQVWFRRDELLNAMRPDEQPSIQRVPRQTRERPRSAESIQPANAIVMETGPNVRPCGAAEHHNTVLKRKSNGSDFRSLDQVLVIEMHQLITSNRASSPEDSARSVVTRAAGRGMESSKVKRLALRYRESHSDHPVE